MTLKSLLIPLTTALFFSGSFVAAKFATSDLGPLTTSFLRYFVALIFLVCLLVFNKKSLQRLKTSDYLKTVLLGLLGIIGYHYFFFISLDYTTVTNTSIINASNPVITALFAALLLKETLRTRNYLGLFLSFVGVVLLISKGDLAVIIKLRFQVGDLLMLLAVFCWALYALLVKPMSKNLNSITITFYTTLNGTVILLFLTLLEIDPANLPTISLRSILAIVYMGTFASGLGYLLYNSSIKTNGPTQTACIVYSCVPIFVSMLSTLIFNEQVSGVIVISILLIIAGLNLMLSKTSNK